MLQYTTHANTPRISTMPALVHFLTKPSLPRRRVLSKEFTRIRGHARFADLHSSVLNNQRFLFSCTFLSVLCFIHRLFSVRNLFFAQASDLFARKHSRYILTLTASHFVYNFFVLDFRSIRGAIVLLNTKLVWILVSSALQLQSLSRCMVAVGPSSQLKSIMSPTFIPSTARCWLL